MIDNRQPRRPPRTAYAITIAAAALSSAALPSIAAAEDKRNKPAIAVRYINPALSEAIVAPRPRFAMKRNAAFLIGDSITAQAWIGGRMPQRAGHHHLAFIGTEAIPGITTQRMLNRLTRLKLFTKLPQRVVVALGSNDTWSATPPAEFRNSLTKLINQIRRPNQPRRIVLVNISATGDPNHYAWSLKLNAVINEFANRPGIKILNWSGAVNHHPNWINPRDPLRLHLSPQGMLARANLYFAALNQIR